MYIRKKLANGDRVWYGKYSYFLKEIISLESLRVSAEGVRQEEKRTCCISQAKGQGEFTFSES